MSGQPCVWTNLTITQVPSARYAEEPCRACGKPQGTSPFTAFASLGDSVIGISASFCETCWPTLSSEEIERLMLSRPPYCADRQHILDEGSRDWLASCKVNPAIPLFEEGTA